MVNDNNNTSPTGNAPEGQEAPEWGSMKDAADIIGVSRMTVTRYARDGRIRTRRKGPRLIEVDLTSLDAIYTPGPLNALEASQ